MYNMAYVYDVNYPNNFMAAAPGGGCCGAVAVAAPTPSLCMPARQCCKPASYQTCDGGRRHHMLATAYGQTTDDVAVGAYDYQM